MDPRTVLAALALVVATACGTPDVATGPVPPGTTAAGVSDADRAAAPELARRFADAANAGDAAGVAATFAEGARFDSAGRIYTSRQDIMDRFLTPEVITAGGRYEVTGSRWSGDRYRVDYTYSTGRGGTEAFYYEFLVRDGLIQDVIGRYS